jgi:hypothetical protein
MAFLERIHARPAYKRALEKGAGMHSFDSMPQPIYLSADIRRIEESAAANAALLADGARPARPPRTFAAQLVSERGKDVLVLAGPATTAATRTKSRRISNRIFPRQRGVARGSRGAAGDAQHAHRKWLDAGGEVLSAVPQDRKWALVVDGLFGIGLTRAPQGRIRAAHRAREFAALPGRSRSTFPAVSNPTPAACSATRCARRTRSRSSR